MSKAKSDNSQLADRRLKPLDPYSSTSTIPHSTPESQEKRVENSEINVLERENEVEKLQSLESEESIQADIERIDAENKSLENSTDEPDTDESITVPTATRAARYEIDEKTQSLQEICAQCEVTRQARQQEKINEICDNFVRQII